MKKNLFLRKSANEQAAADYLYFQATGASTIALVAVGTPPTIGLTYSNNGKAWQSYAIGTTLNLANGERVYFRATTTNTRFSGSTANYYQFTGTGHLDAFGDIMYLISRNLGQTILTSYSFYNLFSGLTALYTPPSCNSRVIPQANSMRRMFYGCTNITRTMSFPTTIVTERCYQEMYRGCTRLTSISPLLVQQMAQYCYYGMFRGCSALSSPPILSATASEYQCCMEMFCDCTSLLSSPEIHLDISAGDITTKDALYSMLQGCTSLAYIKVHFTSWANATGAWVSGVPSGGLFECPSGLSQEFGGSRIPTGWTVQTF